MDIQFSKNFFGEWPETSQAICCPFAILWAVDFFFFFFWQNEANAFASFKMVLKLEKELKG